MIREEAFPLWEECLARKPASFLDHSFSSFFFSQSLYANNGSEPQKIHDRFPSHLTLVNKYYQSPTGRDSDRQTEKHLEDSVGSGALEVIVLKFVSPSDMP
jgi:hypothetical protein